MTAAEAWVHGDGDSRGLSVRCPWCAAAPGNRCTSSATGRPLTMTSAHHARTEAAGCGPPLIALASLPTPGPPVPEPTSAPATDTPRED